MILLGFTSHPKGNFGRCMSLASITSSPHKSCPGLCNTKIMCFSYKRTCKRHQYETNIFCSLDPFRYLQHLNEVAISWHSEKLQVCWFFHNGATSRHEEGTNLRPISLLDIKLLFSIFCTLASDVWWPRGVTIQNPVMSRDKHTHHLGHINKGSIVYRLGII